MAKYNVLISKIAKKQLNKLPDSTANILLKSIKKLSIDPRPNEYKKLKGRNGYRVKKGNYRIIYDILDDKLIVKVVVVGHRKDIYKSDSY